MGDRKMSARSLPNKRRPDFARFAQWIRGALRGGELERLRGRIERARALCRDRGSERHRQRYAPSSKGPHGSLLRQHQHQRYEAERNRARRSGDHRACRRPDATTRPTGAKKRATRAIAHVARLSLTPRTRQSYASPRTRQSMPAANAAISSWRSASAFPESSLRTAGTAWHRPSARLAACHSRHVRAQMKVFR
jgi:hypothetical protein